MFADMLEGLKKQFQLPIRWALRAGCILSFGLSFCTPATDEVDQSRQLLLDFKDPALRRIAELQDKMLTDSLLQYLIASKPEERYLAARAFGSLKADSSIVEPLAALLSDPILEVRTMAAYALGQQGYAQALPLLTDAFERYDTAGFYAQLHRALLEAVGKVGDSTSLRSLASIDTYLPQDTLLLLGQAQGIYRLALRDIVSIQGTMAMVEMALDTSLPLQPRLYAAHYLGRAKVQLDSVSNRLLAGLGESLQRAKSPAELNFVIALSRSLGKTQDSLVALALPRLVAQARDVRVKVELLRAAGKYQHPASHRLMMRSVRDTSEWVAQTAAEQLLTIGNPSSATTYWGLARDSVASAAMPALYAAALRHLPPYYAEYRQYISGELRRRLETKVTNKADEYAKADVLRAMAEWPWNYRFLIDRAFANVSRAERTAAAEALDLIAKRPDIIAYMRSSFPAFKREYADYLQRVFASDDASLQAIAAQTIAIPGLYFRTEYANLDFLAAAGGRLTLPRHVETLYAIEEARAALEPGYVARKIPPLYNHEVNWDIYRSLQPELEVLIETPRGNIVIDLLEQDAPATVVNFVQLVRTRFYDEKVFHRIVPSFVTQGGDPQGDGYGSLDFTLRSETPPLYYDGAGYVGMASAGPHTEGVQFFFTHTATPHLDGRYTIFGRVVSGMDVVLALRAGDKMRMQLR